MKPAAPTVVFVSDPEDPCARDIAAVLPDPLIRSPVLDELLFTDLTVPAILVLHRATLNHAESHAIARLREHAIVSRVVLCAGSHVRYHQLHPWDHLVDAVLPEAIAPWVIGRHTSLIERTHVNPAGRVAVISSSHELRSMLAECCVAGGLDVQAAATWEDAPGGVPAVWDVPTLERGWLETLSVQGRRRPVVALIPFADREIVARACAQGAAACLDLPVHPLDLIHVLDGQLARMRQARPAPVLTP